MTVSECEGHRFLVALSSPALSASPTPVLPISGPEGERLSLTQTDGELGWVAVAAAGGWRWRLEGLNFQRQTLTISLY
ncbi:hypothetical protein AOLI_G00087920 [Acnodon oligacanthus]